MKRSLSLFCLLLALSVSAWAQDSPETDSKPALPKNLSSYNGQTPAKFLRLPAVRKRLTALLKSNYVDFTRRMQVQTPFVKQGDFLVATGQIAHGADAEEAIFIIGLADRSLACAMFSNGTIGFKKSGLGGIHVHTEKSVSAPMNEWLAAKQKLLTK